MYTCFFFKQKTAYEMRISDWSSDVCSSDLFLPIGIGGQIYYAEGLEKLASNIEEVRPTIMVVVPRLFEVLRARMVKTIEKQGKAAQWMLEQALRLGRVRYERGRLPLHEKIGRASCRERVCPHV